MTESVLVAHTACVFYNKTRDISTVVHGGVFTSLATEENIVWLRKSLAKNVLITDRGILGPDPHDLK